MPVCLLCTREFSQEEISDGVVIQHAGSNRIKLVRFSGLIHQFKAERKTVTKIPKGAFVAAKPVVSPPVSEILPEVAVPETAVTPDVETLAQALESHFHPDPPEQSVQSEIVETADADEFKECVVVWLKKDLPSRKLPFGLARPLRSKRHARDGYVFKFDDVVTEGMETIRVGTRVRGRVIEADPGKTSMRLIDIEVYKET
jgi:hypothetical protein